MLVRLLFVELESPVSEPGTNPGLQSGVRDDVTN